MKKRKDEWKQWWEDKTQEWRVGRRYKGGEKRQNRNDSKMQGRKTGRKENVDF